MKLLLDANLSWRLCNKLKMHFDDCSHVDFIGLKIPLTDMQIWDYALSNNQVIVTNDEDFLNLSNMKGFPPIVILLRTGNQSNSFLEKILIAHKEDVRTLVENKDYGVLELY